MSNSIRLSSVVSFISVSMGMFLSVSALATPPKVKKLSLIPLDECAKNARGFREMMDSDLDDDCDRNFNGGMSVFRRTSTSRPQLITDQALAELGQRLMDFFRRHQGQPSFTETTLDLLREMVQSEGVVSTALGFSNYLQERRQFPECIELLELLEQAKVPGAALGKIGADYEFRQFTRFTNWLNLKGSEEEKDFFHKNSMNKSISSWIYTFAVKRRDEGRIEQAEELYNIAAMLNDDTANLSAATMFVELYNQKAAQGGSQPQVSLFTALKKASKHYTAVSPDLGEEAHWALKKVEGLLETYRWWFINHPQLERALTTKRTNEIYSLYQQNLRVISEIMTSKSYGTGNLDDLAEVLNRHGFVLTLVWTNNYLNQHIWTSETGLQVRLKPLTGEFTVGISVTNPLVWNNHFANRVRKYQDGSYVMNDYSNEAIKISTEFLIPAFRRGQWDYSHAQALIQKALDDAHLHLNILNPAKVLNKYKVFEI